MLPSVSHEALSTEPKASQKGDKHPAGEAIPQPPPRSFLTSEFICSNRSFTHIISFNLHKSMKVNINISVQLIEENWLSEVIDSVSFTWLEGVELGFVFRAVQVQRLPKAWVRGSDVCGTLL